MLTTLLMAASMLQSEFNIDQDESYVLAERFARCSALYETFAIISESGGAPANAEELRGVGRGARVAAVFFANLAGVNDTRADEFIDNLFALEINRQAALAERQELDEAQAQSCVELQPLQVEVISAMRRGAYSSPK